MKIKKSIVLKNISHCSACDKWRQTQKFWVRIGQFSNSHALQLIRASWRTPLPTTELPTISSSRYSALVASLCSNVCVCGLAVVQNAFSLPLSNLALWGRWSDLMVIINIHIIKITISYCNQEIQLWQYVSDRLLCTLWILLFCILFIIINIIENLTYRSFFVSKIW